MTLITGDVHTNVPATEPEPAVENPFSPWITLIFVLIVCGGYWGGMVLLCQHFHISL